MEKFDIFMTQTVDGTLQWLTVFLFILVFIFFAVILWRWLMHIILYATVPKVTALMLLAIFGTFSLIDTFSKLTTWALLGLCFFYVLVANVEMTYEETRISDDCTFF